MNNEYQKVIQDKSVWDLMAIVKNKDAYSEEEYMAAQRELQKREIDLPVESNTISTSTNIIHEFVDISNENNTNITEVRFPPKPLIQEAPQSVWNGIFSMLAFIGIFMVVFKMELISVLMLTGVVLIHELGHFFAMKAFKYKDLGVFFIPGLGAFAKGEKNKVSQKQELIILLAGPLPGILIGITLFIVGWRTNLQWILNAGNMFLIINLFNLLPILPLDGGKMVKSLFFEKNQIINMVFMVISILFLCLYAITAKTFILLLIPFALVWSLVNQVKIKKLRRELIQLGFDIERNYDELDNKSFWLIREQIGQTFRAYSKSIIPGQYASSVDELRNINMVKSILMNHPEADLKWPGKMIFGSIVIFNLLLLLVWGLFYLAMLKVIG